MPWRLLAVLLLLEEGLVAVNVLCSERRRNSSISRLTCALASVNSRLSSWVASWVLPFVTALPRRGLVLSIGRGADALRFAILSRLLASIVYTCIRTVQCRGQLFNHSVVENRNSLRIPAEHSRWRISGPLYRRLREPVKDLSVDRQD